MKPNDSRLKKKLAGWDMLLLVYYLNKQTFYDALFKQKMDV